MTITVNNKRWQILLEKVHQYWAALGLVLWALPRDDLRDGARAQAGLLSAEAPRVSRLPPRLVPAYVDRHLLEPYSEPGLLAPGPA